MSAATAEKRALLAAFGVFGLFWGAWAALLPAVKEQVGLSDGELGLALAVVALAAPPKQGVVAPGSSFGGLRLGATAAEVEARWGRDHVRCRSCARTTWYFTLRPRAPQALAVELAGGRVVALYTLWAPPGWRTTRGLAIGNPAARVAALYGPLARVECGGYHAFLLRTARATTAIYVLGETVWGFGLSRAAAPPCR